MKHLSKNETNEYIMEILIDSDTTDKTSILFFKYRNRNDINIEYHFEDMIESIITQCDVPKHIINMLLECPDIYVDLLRDDYSVEYDGLNDIYLINAKINVGHNNYNIQAKLDKHIVDNAELIANMSIKFNDTVKGFENVIRSQAKQIDEYRLINDDLLHMLYFPKYVTIKIKPNIKYLYENRIDYKNVQQQLIYQPGDQFFGYRRTFKNELHDMLVAKGVKWYNDEIKQINGTSYKYEIWDKVFESKKNVIPDQPSHGYENSSIGYLKYFFDVMLFHKKLIPYEIHCDSDAQIDSPITSLRCMENMTIVFKQLPAEAKYENMKIVSIMDSSKYSSHISFNSSIVPQAPPNSGRHSTYIEKIPILYSFE